MGKTARHHRQRRRRRNHRKKASFVGRAAPILTLDDLTKPPKEIHTTETQLRLPSPRPMLNPPKNGNRDRYYDYHQKKTSDREEEEIRREMLHPKDVSEDPLIVEAKVKGYLLVMCFENEGLYRRTTMKFTVIKAPSPYNIILRRSGLKGLRAISSTIHSLMKFPTPKGIAIPVTRLGIILECRRLEKKQATKEKPVNNGEKKEEGAREASMTKEVLVNPVIPDKLVIIEGGLLEECKSQLKMLLKNNMEFFAWEPSDMTGVPRRIIKHTLNANTSVELMC
ncbi:hypothetical protein Tco_0626751 [Tanacetum coccineum]|uniref:Reverse transcriptase domain-containing protein n=1 Tax=Tanacetum coccineum TaxID=301880 RepID=A0ABQ4WKI2_9ASTR